MNWNKNMNRFRQGQRRSALGLVGCLILLFPCFGAAQSLSALYAMAKEKDSGLQQRYQLLLAEQYRIPQATAQLKPDVTLNAQVGRTYEQIDSRSRPIESSDNIGSPDRSPPTLENLTFSGSDLPLEDDYEDSRLTLNASIPIYNAQARNNVKQVSSEYDEALWQFAETELELIAEVLETYFELVRASDLFEIISLELDSTDELARLSESRYEEDLGNKIDFLDSRVRAEQLAAEVIDIRNQIRQAQTELSKLTGEIHFANHSLINFDTQRYPELMELRRWLEITHSQSPRIMLARQQENSAWWQMKTARSASYPSLSFLGSLIEERRGFSDISNESDNSTLELALVFEVPLYQGGQNRARTREMVHRFAAAQYAVSDQSAEIEQNLRLAFQQAKTQRERVTLLETALASAQEAQQLHREAQEQGLESQIDTLSAERELYRVMRANSSARSDYILSLLELYKISGRLNDSTMKDFESVLIQRSGQPQTDWDNVEEMLVKPSAKYPSGQNELKRGDTIHSDWYHQILSQERE